MESPSCISLSCPILQDTSCRLQEQAGTIHDPSCSSLLPPNSSGVAALAVHARDHTLLPLTQKGCSVSVEQADTVLWQQKYLQLVQKTASISHSRRQVLMFA